MQGDDYLVTTMVFSRKIWQTVPRKSALRQFAACHGSRGRCTMADFEKTAAGNPYNDGKFDGTGGDGSGTKNR